MGINGFVNRRSGVQSAQPAHSKKRSRNTGFPRQSERNPLSAVVGMFGRAFRQAVRG